MLPSPASERRGNSGRKTSEQRAGVAPRPRKTLEEALLVLLLTLDLRRLPPDDEKFALARRLQRWRERRVRRTERVYFITTRFYRGDPAGSSLFALPCL